MDTIELRRFIWIMKDIYSILLHYVYNSIKQKMICQIETTIFKENGLYFVQSMKLKLSQRAKENKII